MDSDLLHLQAIGPVTVRRRSDLETVSRLAQPRPLALFCYLALARPRGLHSRDSLIALLWPERDQASGRQALRNALHAIRRALGSDIVVTAGDGLVGVDASRMTCDVWAIERGAPSLAATARIDGVHLFEGFHVSGAHAFGEWMGGERSRIDRVRQQRAVELTGTSLSSSASPVIRGRSSASTGGMVNAESGPPQRTDVRTFLIRGHYLFLRAAHSGVKDELDECRRNFERALAIDAKYAPAIAGLANYYAVAARRGVLGPFEKAFAQAIVLSEQALAIDPSLAVPHVHFGVEALYLRDDFERAGREFEMAVRLDPLYPEGHRFYGVWLGLTGRTHDAVASMREAVRIEPDIPTMLNSLAAALVADGDLLAAESILCETLMIDAGFRPARERLLRLLEQQERFDTAVGERLRPPGLPRAAQFDAALRADGSDGYRRERAMELGAQITALETQLIERTPPTVNDLFSPPAVRLVAALAERGDWARAKAWRLQACADRPGLARWFEALPELSRGQ